MKLVSFNLWGGTIYEPLMDYISEQSATTDIFCFQEVFSALPGAPETSSGARMFLFEELQELLKDFSGFFDLRSQGCDFQGLVDAPVSHGLAVFVRSRLETRSINSKLIGEVGELPDRLVKAQVLTVASANKLLSVINFHGVAQPGNKLDTPERLEQSKKLLEIARSLPNRPVILCGDLNLMPETESIKILEQDLNNLIKEFNITNTRNEVSWKRFSNIQKFSDFVFVSPGLKIKSFEVPYNEVSDHLPMLLDFDLSA